MRFRERLDVERLVQALGIRCARRGNTLKACCPNPDHPDRNPSWSIVDAPGSAKHGGHRCMACGFGGGPWELVMAVRGVDERTAAEFVNALIHDRPRQFDGLPNVIVQERKRVQSEYVLPLGVQIPSVDGSQWRLPFFNYLVDRGVTPEQMERWHIGFATTGPLQWRIVIPIHTRGRLVAHVARAIFADRKRYDMPTESVGAFPNSAVFGEPLLDPALRTLTIAEGVFSALALERAIAPNPVALLGSDWGADKAAILTRVDWDHVILATDPDAAGDRVAHAAAVSFRRAKISRLRLGQSPDDLECSVLRAAIEQLL